MSQKRHLQISDFDKTQMYKDRNPIWIKLHCAILDDYEFSALPDETKFHALGLTILAARLNNKLPEDERWLRQKINANSEINLKLLLEIGFLSAIKDAKNSFNACNSKKTKGKSVKQLEKLCNTEQNRTEQMRTDENTTHHTTTAATGETAEAANAENGGVVVCVDFKSSKTEDENRSENRNGFVKGTSGSGHHSQFNFAECLSYAEICKSRGDNITNPHALANKLFQTGTADASIRALLYPEQQKEIESAQFGAPKAFTEEPCRKCFGAKMSDVEGKGYRACVHCKNERGKSTGLEPEGERGDD